MDKVKTKRQAHSTNLREVMLSVGKHPVKHCHLHQQYSSLYSFHNQRSKTRSESAMDQEKSTHILT